MDVIQEAYARAKSPRAVRYKGLLLRRGIGGRGGEGRERSRREHQSLRQS
jgi:hypothetical protein